LNARECLERLGANRLSFEEMANYFSSKVPRLFVLYQRSEAGKKPFLARGNKPGSKFVTVFTDADSARRVRVDNPEAVKMLEEPALPFLIKAVRSEADGIVLNPGLPSLVFLTRHHLMSLVREYAAEQLSRMPGPWVPTQDGNLLLVEYERDRYTVAIYVSEADARYISQKSGGQVVRHSWSVVFERCRDLGAQAPFLHFGLPEQTLLAPHHAEKILRGPHFGAQDDVHIEHPFVSEEPAISAYASRSSEDANIPERTVSSGPAREPAVVPVPPREQPETAGVDPGRNREAAEPREPVAKRPIDPDVEAGLKKLEKATIEGQGMGNGWEVCRAMAELRRIFVVVDPDGNMVILAGQDHSPIVDFFTSEAHAWRLIEEARRKNPNLPPMTPRLISTKKLYRALAPRRPIVWINRGSEEAWTSIMGDTLPYVLQLKEQMEQATLGKQ
jgi:hypothetical protein